MTKSSVDPSTLDHLLATPVTFRPIGRVAVDAADSPSDDSKGDESTIILDPALVDGLFSLSAGQRLVVVFLFHLSSGYDLRQHPRGDRSRAEKGVFALRSPQRPNPIGITEVEVVAIAENVLRVKGLDAWDGTPVLDLKPV